MPTLDHMTKRYDNQQELNQQSAVTQGPPPPPRKYVAARASTGVPMCVSSKMSLNDVVCILGNHKCKEITERLDLEKCSNFPVCGGGFGDIYQGTLKGGDDRVAIKCARVFISSTDAYQSTVKQMAHELYAWSKCKHKNVLELLGLAYFRNRIAIISPWMDNGTLPQYLLQYPNADRDPICIQISTGLAYMHERDLVHGDIKGANVLISQDGTAKLADFGSATLKNISLQFTGQAGDSIFSVRWAAPELLSGAVACNKESDVYALGMTILEVLTGEIPFPDRTEQMVIVDVMLRGKQPKRPTKPCQGDSTRAEEQWLLLQSCWSRPAHTRPQASEVAEQLDKMAGQAPD